MLVRRIHFVVVLTLPFTAPWVVARTSDAVAPPLDGPDHWVAFQGHFTESAPDGESPVTGAYYQASNGSHRLDSTRRTTLGTDLVWSTIVNTVLQRRFVLDPGQSAWDSYPLEPRPGGWDRPLKRSSAISMGEGPAFEGFRTVRDDTGRLQQLLVPDLNFFPVWQSRPGHTRQYTSVSLGEPPSTLFEPPPGAEVRSHDQPKGRRGR